MFGLSGPIIYLVGVLALLAAGFGTGWKVEGWRWQASEKAAVEAAVQHHQQEAQQAADASAALAAQQEKTNGQIRTITKTVDRIVVRRVYRNVCLDADGLHAVNAALAGKGAPAGKPDGSMPAADAAQ